MWNKLPFEIKMEEFLKKDYGAEEGEKWFAKYTAAKTYLVEQVYEQIRGRQPDMSDHGERHIANVLRNVHGLIENRYADFDGINLYCLGLIVLFHDVGNIVKRANHNENIADIYNKVRGKKAEYNQERFCILSAAKAHTGFSLDGSTDALKDVPEVEPLDGQKIYLRELAAILRLADECAEGHQRTSDYMNQTSSYKRDSKKYHDYASMTEVLIDSGGERIVLKYNVDVTKEHISDGWLEEMLQFISKRICKLDIERGYCKHYTEKLYKFKKTEASLNFTYDGSPLAPTIGPIYLEDKFPLPLAETEINREKIMPLLDVERIKGITEEIRSKIAKQNEK